MPVGFCEGHMPLQQRRHHIFRDGLFVAKAIAYNGCIGNRIEIDGVVPCAWHVKKLQLPRLRQCVELASTSGNTEICVASPTSRWKSWLNDSAFSP
jgi:hypothetical protein